MLSKPNAGWTDFQLEGTSAYGLSYLDNIPFEWLDQAIHGLETLLPFCVKGFMEPGRFLCVVSYWNCHIICEGEDNKQLLKDDISAEYSHTSMLNFCKSLYNDINTNYEAWVSFCGYQGDLEKDRIKLRKLLDRLGNLISEKEECFDARRCFL